MTNFSRSHFATTASRQASQSEAASTHSAEPAEHGTPDAADPSLAPDGAQAAGEDVDFDTAIAEVLMTLAADRGTSEAARPADGPLPSAVAAPREGGAGLHDDDAEDHAEDEDADEDAEQGGSPSPEALLAAEAATFRLLGELDRLWHRAA